MLLRFMGLVGGGFEGEGGVEMMGCCYTFKENRYAA